ncbi:MAG: hypothetical protein V2J16_06900 [Thermoleophilia bacterium]|jgi:hypothetical protein|nr:hypothetical protein [Thermoleophilia bacterium]
MNIIKGIAALDQTSFWTDYGSIIVYGDLRTWGWILLVWGVLLLLAALGVYRGGELGRWFGIIAASVNLFFQFVFLPAYPFWAITIMVLDVLVIYALAVYGGQSDEA